MLSEAARPRCKGNENVDSQGSISATEWNDSYGMFSFVLHDMCAGIIMPLRTTFWTWDWFDDNNVNLGSVPWPWDGHRTDPQGSSDQTREIFVNSSGMCQSLFRPGLSALAVHWHFFFNWHSSWFVVVKKTNWRWDKHQSYFKTIFYFKHYFLYFNCNNIIFLFFFSWNNDLSFNYIAVSYTHLTLPTTPYV